MCYIWPTALSVQNVMYISVHVVCILLYMTDDTAPCPPNVMHIRDTQLAGWVHLVDVMCVIGVHGVLDGRPMAHVSFGKCCSMVNLCRVSSRVLHVE